MVRWPLYTINIHTELYTYIFKAKIPELLAGDFL